MSKNDISLPEGISPEVLDQLWSRFDASEEVAVLNQIASVLDWKDIVRLRFQEWLEATSPKCWAEEPYNNYREMFIRCMFPIDYEKRSIDGPLDLDLHVALLARNGDLKFNELPFPLTQNELLHLAMKSAALWSLRSRAKQNGIVASFCNEASKKSGGPARLHLALN